MSRVVHFEIHCEDPESSAQFYRTVFGWTIQKRQDQEYWLIHTGRQDEAGINGGIKPRMTDRNAVVPNISVTNLDGLLAKVTESGGRLLGEKVPIPQTGYIAYCQDPEGNVFSLLEKDSSVT